MEMAEGWPSEWLRGVLGLCVLGVLRGGTGHGYAIAQRLATAGLGEVKGGTLYPLLGRLQDAGWVAGEWEPGQGGPGRKVFRITRAGLHHLDAMAEQWRDFGVVTTRLAAGAVPEHVPDPDTGIRTDTEIRTDTVGA